MGMYTEFHFNVELIKDVPKEIIDILEYMLLEDNDNVDLPVAMPNHPFFKTDRWSWMLLCDSYYFSADTNSTLRFDDIADAYFLCVRCNLKNYTGEIQKFIEWIDPYVEAESGDFLGFSRYEESEEPTIIRKK